jgi:hypothetical protein
MARPLLMEAMTIIKIDSFQKFLYNSSKALPILFQIGLSLVMSNCYWITFLLKEKEK